MPDDATRSRVCHCGQPVLPRDPDPWEGRMDAYCEDCALNRCDCYPDECPVKSDSPTSKHEPPHPRTTGWMIEAIEAALEEAARRGANLRIAGDRRGTITPLIIGELMRRAMPDPGQLSVFPECNCPKCGEPMTEPHVIATGVCKQHGIQPFGPKEWTP